MSAPTVSVLITSYNREKHLAASIESVLAQTYQDYEVLVLDNCSTDRSAAIAEDYAQRDGRIRVVVNKTNLGQFGNRNRAIELARGRLLKYQDSDDLLYPHCLATMVGPLEAYPAAGFALSGSNYWTGGPCPMLSTPRMSFQREFLGGGMFDLGPSCGLFRAEFLRETGGFEDIGAGSDTWFWLKACARCSVLLLPADLFWYRIHPDQEYQSEKAKRDYAILHARIWRLLRDGEIPLDREELEQARRNFFFILTKLTYRDVRAGRYALARFRLREAGVRWSDYGKYLRRQRRNQHAGTPLTAEGDYLIPNWKCFQTSQAETAAAP